MWAFNELTANLKPESVAAFTVAVEAWEADPTQPNPFVSVADGMFSNLSLIIFLCLSGTPAVTENDVKLALAQEEAVEILQGSGIIHHTLPPSVLVTAGMELEIHQ